MSKAAEETTAPLPFPDDFTESEFDIAVKVVGRIGEDLSTKGDSSFYKSKRCRVLRKAMVPLINDLKSRFPSDPDKYHRAKRLKTQRKAATQRQRAKDMEYINKTKLRAERLATLEKLQQQGSNVPMIPDGPANASEGATLRALTDEVSPSTPHNDKQEEQQQQQRLNRDRSCYTCKVRYKELHEFYDQLCPKCASLNEVKRDQSADLAGRVCLVTGARVKIGFQVALKLLRAGATVIATTRFPNEAAVRYSREKDFSVWHDRLSIMAMDFRNLGGVLALAAYINAHFERLDILINNACQTIRRPPAYYAHLMKIEKCPVKQLGDDKRLHEMLSKHEAFMATQPSMSNMLKDSSDVTELLAEAPHSGIDASAGLKMPKSDAPTSSVSMMSQLPLLDSDAKHDSELFPAQTFDVNRQQLDLRTSNSWLLKLDEVELPELVEVFSINAIAPFVLNSKLKPMLLRSPAQDKYVINVSAMEGKFYRYKTSNHPHTNMAKAALNMLTRTSSEDYAKSGIYMNSVDTGWINDENPLERAAATAAKHNFQTPIDEVDAAARILDPVFSGVNDPSQRIFGKFMKDYRESPW